MTIFESRLSLMPTDPFVRAEKKSPGRAPTVTLSDLSNRVLIQVWSENEPSLGGLFQCSRPHAYGLVADGHVPSVRLGRRVAIPVAPLLAMLNSERSTPGLTGAEEEVAHRLRLGGVNTVPSSRDVEVILAALDPLVDRT